MGEWNSAFFNFLIFFTLIKYQQQETTTKQNHLLNLISSIEILPSHTNQKHENIQTKNKEKREKQEIKRGELPSRLAII